MSNFAFKFSLRRCTKVGIDALHGGGMSRRAVRNTNTAVYVGICNNDYDSVRRCRLTLSNPR